MLSVSIGGNYDSEFLYQPSKWNLPPTAKSLTRRQHCVVQLQLICMHCSRQRWSLCARNNIHTSEVKRMIDGSPMMSFHSHAKALARVVCQLTMSYIFNVLKLELFWLWSSNWVSHYIYFHSFINFPSITANFFAPSFCHPPSSVTRCSLNGSEHASCFSTMIQFRFILFIVYVARARLGGVRQFKVALSRVNFSFENWIIVDFVFDRKEKSARTDSP